MIESFNLTPNTPEQTKCILSGNNDPKYAYFVENLKTCVPLMAPGYLTGNATVEERIMASKGLVPDLINGTHYSMCSYGMPCKNFNHFLLNGTVADLSHDCGTHSNGQMWKQFKYYELLFEMIAM